MNRCANKIFVFLPGSTEHPGHSRKSLFGTDYFFSFLLGRHVPGKQSKGSFALSKLNIAKDRGDAEGCRKKKIYFPMEYNILVLHKLTTFDMLCPRTT